MKTIRVAIIEDVYEDRNALAASLQGAPEIYCEQCFDNAASAMRHLPTLKPDVVLISVNLPGNPRFEAIIHLRNLYPQLQFMALAKCEDDDKIFNALKAGATGFLLKSATPAKLVEAVHELYEGGSPMSAQIARKVVCFLHNLFPLEGEFPYENLLSHREKEVLENLRTGLLYKQIANLLQISEHTVKTHCRHIYEKLHVTTRGEAVYTYFKERQG